MGDLGHEDNNESVRFYPTLIQMHLAVPHRRYPSSLNHTPRTFELSSPSDTFTIKSVKFQSQTQNSSDLLLPNMATAISDFPTTGTNLSSMAIHRKPIAPRQCASFSIDRPISTPSRRHSWASSYDLIASGILDNVPKDKDLVKRMQAKAASLPRPGATFDMAYFLKNTGPPPQREDVEREKKIVGKKKSLTIFKKRKEVTFGGVTQTNEKALENFVPPERVEQKVTLNGLFTELMVLRSDFLTELAGKKYLHIIPNSATYPVSSPAVEGCSSVSHLSKPGRLSVSFSDRTNACGTEALDSWISTFTIQHKQAEWSVKPPTSQDIRNISAIEPPRRSYSVKSNTKSWLPASDSGFGLSVIDEPAVSETYSGVPDPSTALSSHPPSFSPSPIPSPISHPRSVPIQIPEHQGISVNLQTFTVPANENKLLKENINYRQSVDRLAGQGLRRPFREQDHTLSGAQEGRDSIMSIKQPLSSSPEVPEHAEIPELRHSITSAVQSRGNRESVVRARKIRELQRARQNLNTATKSKMDERPVTPPNATSEDEVMVFPTPPDSAPRKSQARLSEFKTGYTPVTANMRISPVMLVAEQIPVQRGKQVKKPAHLVLRERRGSKPIAIAVRAGEDGDATAEIKQNSIPASNFATHESNVVDEEVNQSVSCAMPEQKAASVTPPGVPPKSLARATSSTSNYKHPSTPLLTTPIPVMGAPQAVTATATAHHRTSVCSSHTSTSKEARLEARLEALERENRLLEAALMAVLKTSGTLNRCPCVLLSKRQEAVDLRSRPASRQMLQNRVKADEYIPNEEERRGSVESNASGVSALEVYLGTRL
ncbi:hypothetical protein EJ08DRAFT_663475 [Tothia fuscella]|uniref:Uncharacterized protein n=1 Tax=Tothia fuscella TaxID=1048955 RepID=A0A9P4TUU3_9PEZI|nr:hypothetical protein EJ08DRAFT_663475 [Tothia fuscella]